jgi:hypothetical protein
MNFLLRLLCFLILLNSIGCTPQQKLLVKAQPQKQCLAVCAKRFESCKAICTNNCSICSENATQSAIKNYTNYVHEKRVEGGTIMRGLKSYRDPLQCRKVTCNCYADLSTCEQNCTGIIHKQLRAVPYCA